MPYTHITQNLLRIRAELAEIAKKRGTAPATLVAVTKSAPDDEVLALAAAGAEHMAENRVQNYRARRELLDRNGYRHIPLHLIGSLQTNKVKYIAGEVPLIQSLDSLRLANEIEKQGCKQGRLIPVLVEVNSGREAAKGGLLPEDVPVFITALCGGAYPHILLRGLMTMAPDCDTEEDYRPYFRETRALFDRLCAEGAFAKDPILSMGMSDSYRVAAEEGATMVRVGRLLFRPADS